MRSKKREPYIITPSTKDIAFALSSYPSGCHILLSNSDKDYSQFLHELLSNSFYQTEDEKWSLKSVAAKSGTKSTKISLWLHQIYDDIFELNMATPSLFKQEGLPCILSFRNFDMRAGFNIWLKRCPNLYEHFSWQFVKAKVGTSWFWVRDITYELEDPETSFYIQLDGGILNRYEHFLKDRALFDGVLSIMDEYNMHPHEIEQILRQNYR